VRSVRPELVEGRTESSQQPEHLRNCYHPIATDILEYEAKSIACWRLYMSFFDERSAFEHEIDSYYADYPTDLSNLEAELHETSSNHPEWSPYKRKAFGYDFISERCRVKIFKHFPFYFELDTGRLRSDLGEGGIGGWMRREPFGQQMEKHGSDWWSYCNSSGLSTGWTVMDTNHHSLGFDNVFQYGLLGLIQKAENRLATVSTQKERDFLEAIISGNKAVIKIAERHAREAERMISGETDPIVRERLQRIADTARRVPANPPATFYEALNTLHFMREIVQELEGVGSSVLSHWDRILYPYYVRDIETGYMTRDEARDLVRCMIAFHDIRFGMKKTSEHAGTNTTIGIGGCDASGDVIFNELTQTIVETYMELGQIDPKLNARISDEHPETYFKLLANAAAKGVNSLAIFNDDVLIPANAKMGKAMEDCRLYVGGGCQENILENTEINSRATIYLNLAQIFLMGMFSDRWSVFTQREEIQVSEYSKCLDFESIYSAFLENLQSVVNAHIRQRNATEKEGARYNPCPLHSSTLSDCIENSLDMFEGGARYNAGSVSLTGVGNLIDSLNAVKEVVFRQKTVSLTKLGEILDNNFDGDESFRQYLINRVPKFGWEDEEIRELSAKVFHDIAKVSSGQPNSRGGRYEASLFPFRTFIHFGNQTQATPDGRKAGEYLSPGMSPSMLALGEKCGISQVINALEPVDMTDYPVVAVLDIKLPVVAGYLNPEIVSAVIHRFVENGGSVMQMNCVNPDDLIDAKVHPEDHKDLVVRVSGYSAYFNILSETTQNEIIERTLANV